jgi:glycosyltransferase involved in cell wall biosynthesis
VTPIALARDPDYTRILRGQVSSDQGVRRSGWRRVRPHERKVGFVTLRSNAARAPQGPESSHPENRTDRFDIDESAAELRAANSADAPARRLTVLIVVPTLHTGAADTGALDLVRILAGAGHRAIVVSQGGRLEGEVAKAGGVFLARDVASTNPFVMLRNALALAGLVRRERCDVVHAHGRAAAWSAYLAARVTRTPFLTTWYKGFREQNLFKHLYNSVMARGTRVVAVSDQIAELIHDRHGTPEDRIAVVPLSVDFARFDPHAVDAERLEAVRRAWGVKRDARVILVVGRMLRRKGHHVVVTAVHRLKQRGLKDFLCVFAGEDQGRSRYTGELWDQVNETGTTDVVRLVGTVDDMPAAYAVSTVVVSAAVQPEGLQRAVLEAQAMGRPVVVSDLGAGPDVVLAPPAVAEDRMTGLRVPAGDADALAAALIRLFSLPDPARAAIGARGRGWVSAHFNAPDVARAILGLYGEVAKRRS